MQKAFGFADEGLPNQSSTDVRWDVSDPYGFSKQTSRNNDDSSTKAAPKLNANTWARLRWTTMGEKKCTAIKKESVSESIGNISRYVQYVYI